MVLFLPLGFILVSWWPILPRIVLPGLERVKRSKVWKDIPYVILVIIVLVSMSIGVAYFHGVNLKNLADLSGKYTEDWFWRNNNSVPPPDIYDYIKSPESNETTPSVPEDIISRLNLSYINFLIKGQTPLLAWRLMAFDVYEVGEGWAQGPDDYDLYGGETHGGMRFKVIKPVIIEGGASEVDLVSLWQIGYGVEASDFSPVDMNVSDLVFSPRITLLNERLFTYVSSRSPAKFFIEYYVYGDVIDEYFVAEYSASVGELESYILNNPWLNRFTEIPAGYFDAYPEVGEAFSSLNITSDMSVFGAVSLVISYFALEYNVTFGEPEFREDPVASFIRNGGGSFVSYVYTVALALRAYNIPSRVILGYVGGFYNASDDMTYLRISDLMLWIEVYDPGVGGWVPYSCLMFDIDVQNLVETGLRLSVMVNAPRYVQGYPAVYLDENFTITLLVEGPGAGRLSGEVVFIDYNESEVLGISYLEEYSSDMSFASLTTSYEVFYNITGREPRFGIHVIVVVYKHYRIFAVIALLKRVSVQP